jgi:hypothetical protein
VIVLKRRYLAPTVTTGELLPGRAVLLACSNSPRGSFDCSPFEGEPCCRPNLHACNSCGHGPG